MNTANKKGNLKIPDRWTDYTPIGNVIPGTRFITFKVPLKENFNSILTEELWFTPQMLLKHMTDSNHSLGLVIDLTFTTRYYEPAEFMRHNVQYQKILVPGHEIPSMKIINMFYKAVDGFLESSPESLIGVHCTHGVNRTGYIVCRYMVERLGMKPEEALEAYKTARGYAVERENYIADLKTRSREFGVARSWDQCRKQFQNSKSHYVQKVGEMQHPPTGGGSEVKLSPSEESTASTMEGHPFLDGIYGGVDSDLVMAQTAPVVVQKSLDSFNAAQAVNFLLPVWFRNSAPFPCLKVASAQTTTTTVLRSETDCSSEQEEPMNVDNVVKRKESFSKSSLTDEDLKMDINKLNLEMEKLN